MDGAIRSYVRLYHLAQNLPKGPTAVKNPFSRTPVNSDVRPLALTDDHTKPHRITRISNPDTRTPLPHTANGTDPHENADAFRALVRQKVAALAAAGGLDQDTLQALSHEIGSWAVTWRHKVEQDAVSRTEVAQLLLAQTVQDKIVCSRELASARADRAEVADTRARILRDWGLTSQVPVDATGALSGATPVISSRVLAVAHGETAAESETHGDPNDTPRADSSVIDLPVAPSVSDGIPVPTLTLTSQELSA